MELKKNPQDIIHTGEYLNRILTPDDLRKLKPEELPMVCKDLRDFIIDAVSQKGGHFGASLGVVELTVALHYVLNTPYDQLVWDVGHQAYGHKILTGRRNVFHTNRKYGGISGFPKRSESEYDTFGVGHSSTSISAALGMAVAGRYLNENRKYVAVIGDGAMTAGLAFEGLNHAGWEKANMLVVLNDNCMSIDPNVGALKEYLTDITTSQAYNKAKDKIWELLGKLSHFGKSAREVVSKLEHSLKSALLKESNYFESLNFRYFGPTDGHDVIHLVEILRDVLTYPGPKILHVLTKKGKGYKFSEEGDETFWHAPGIFNKETGEIIKVTPPSPQPPKYQDVFGHTIVELAEKNPKIMGITPAMPSGCSLNIMMKAMPHRAFDVGIAEQHAVTFSAGLATQGLIPFCNIYSSFMQRAYDQVIHDVALQKLKVVFCLDRGGLVGADGPTHHGAFDLAYFRCIPNMIVSAPMNEEELRNLMYTAQLDETPGPFSIRYPRGNGVMVNWKTPFRKIEIGKGRKLKEGKNLCILSVGHPGNFVAKAIELFEKKNKSMEIGHFDMRFVKPLDEELLHEAAAKYETLMTVEDGCIQGGFGSAVLEFLSDHQYKNNVIRLGIPDAFIEHGEPHELYDEIGISPEKIRLKIQEVIKQAHEKDYSAKNRIISS
jgi:1-deoxy-D-xylulose-5-phosphate synthase